MHPRHGLVAAIVVAALTAGAQAQTPAVWTTGGPIDYTKLGLSGQTVVWADNGGSSHETYAKAWLEPFATATGINVVSDTPVDYARIKAQVEAGNVTQDIITGSPYVIEAQCGTLFEPIPADKFYVGDIDQRYLGKCSIPHTIALFMVLYNKTMYKDNPPTSCADYFDLTKYPGKRGMWSSTIGNILEVADWADGVAPDKMYPLDVDRALKKLDTIKSDISFYQNLAVGTEGMMNGNYGMMITSKERAYDAIKGGADYAPLWQCAVEQTSTLGIVKGTPHLDAALALAGYVTTPAAQSARMAITAHTPVTKTYSAPTDPMLASFLPSAHPDPHVLMDNTWWGANFDATEQRFQQWQVE